MENQTQPQGADNDAAKAAIATRNQENGKVQATLGSLVQKYATGLLGDQRAAQFAAQLMVLKQEMPALAKCSNDSIMSAMMACVHVDVMPNTPQQEAYIIPYGGKATFQMGYKGLKELAYRSGQVQSLNGECVFKGDTFDIEFGSERKLTHKPNLDVDRSNPTAENVTHVYITAVLANGEKPFFVMTVQEIEKIRLFAKNKNGGKDSPAWREWWGQQALKTVLKRAAKMLPSSSKDNRFQMAVYYDSLAEAGKLKFDEKTGTIIEGNIVDDEPVEPPKKEIKNYAAPQTDQPQNDTNTPDGSEDNLANANTVSTADGEAVPQGQEPTEPAENVGQDNNDEVPTTEPEAQPSGSQGEQTSSPDNESQVEAPTARGDLMQGINEMIEYLAWGFAEKMRYFKSVIGTSNIGNMSNEQLGKLYLALGDLANQKTEEEAAKADEVNNTTTDRGE